MIKRMTVALAGIALVFSMSSCGITADDASDPAYQTLRYEGGDVGGSKFKECVPEGEKLASNDAFYSYPKTQRQDKWDTANFERGANSADYPDLELTDKNGVPVAVKITVPFTLNTSCEPIEVNGKEYPGGAMQVFHEVFGKTRNGYFDPTAEGNSTYGEGWLWLMDTYISTCVTQQLTPKVRAEDAEDLWLKDEVRLDIVAGDSGSELREQIQSCVNNAMETDIQFYNIGNVTVDNITPDTQFQSLYRERQEAETRAETAEFNKDAQIAEAKAQAAVAREQAKVKQAEISGVGGPSAYAKLQAIEGGLNPFQPTYIVGGTQQ